MQTNVIINETCDVFVEINQLSNMVLKNCERVYQYVLYFVLCY